MRLCMIVSKTIQPKGLLLSTTKTSETTMLIVTSNETASSVCVDKQLLVHKNTLCTYIKCHRYIWNNWSKYVLVKIKVKFLEVQTG